ncbi:cobalamin biosynthesis protein CobE [Pseudomonas agarici]|uniref:Cobalamin biosynthesis protein CobE n=1 Tax=Pseudomonas agarici TaxID=46677 RepID=A0A0X1SYJ5_PSEAA|nr:cobalamin biosynthesis protein [Pseudomonas agarici]AMB84897.1 cobalamin biosynthesis protein CobE [Pseudomonas agarici]NWB93135.1 cobalamin biosynthesis protein [Pseudomonas agarici]NWC08492.1 cobalamin biosynthesis protein [Pseudomonas agarici]SEK68728.1 cobalt-precorrin 5A hydrolase [Pseudomonas agarici]
MNETWTTPTLAVGFGCRQGCSASTLQALLEQSLQVYRIDLKALKGLASINDKQHEPGLLELAQRLSLPLLFFSAAELAPYEARLSHRSDLAFERTGCHGVAESAALALAERLGPAPASLLISRQKHPLATFALAWTGQNPR